jgi:DeoR family fructose operon transcriptional repressor
MVPDLRREAILASLDIDKIFYLEDILKKFDMISESTLRRDLKVLEDSKQIELLRGGVIRKIAQNDSHIKEENDLDLDIKQNLNIKNKKVIAKYAASLIEDNDVIYIDSGTSCSYMMKYLENKNIVIVTSNVTIIEEYRTVSNNIEIISVGGKLNKKLGSFSGPITENNLRSFNFNKAFLGTTSINSTSGMTTPDLAEANKKRIVKENSNKSYILVDSSKFNKFAMCKVCDLNECDIITNKYVDLLDNCKSYSIAK